MSQEPTQTPIEHPEQIISGHVDYWHKESLMSKLDQQYFTISQQMWDAKFKPINTACNELAHLHADLHGKLVDLGYRYDVDTKQFIKK